MDHFLLITVIILGLIVIFGFFNEKVTKLTYEISLLLFSCIAGLLFLGCAFITKGTSIQALLTQFRFLNIEDFLMEGVLCFMLFAGSCHMRLRDFKKHARAISLLSIGATLLGAIFYGFLFYGISNLFQLGMTLPMCLMFGSITAPTDPIAATSILKKFHLPSHTGFIMEGESLLNDGVGVALFACFSGLVMAQKEGGFFQIMAKELFGAIDVGLVVSITCFFLFKYSQDAIRRIFISLFAVSTAYLLCEYFGFSGAIASVVCGVMFSACRNLAEERGMTLELELYDHFWEILDTLLNSVLYVMLGLSFIHMFQMPHLLLVSASAILLNLICRSSSVGAMTFFMGTLPDRFKRGDFIKLLTWGGLRGGLSIALAMSTQNMVSYDLYMILLGGTYAIVLFTTIVQGLTIPIVYKKIERNLYENNN